jgi:hypothetical protein
MALQFLNDGRMGISVDNDDDDVRDQSGNRILRILEGASFHHSGVHDWVFFAVVHISGTQSCQISRAPRNRTVCRMCNFNV